MSSHKRFLQRALMQAKQRQGRCAPNPAVGAVVVKDGQIISEACYHGPGQLHAERQALLELDNHRSSGASIYVTLSPCSHQGRTPPCTDILIEKGIGEVIYGHRDIAKHQSASFSDILTANSIKVTYFPLTEINQFYRSYDYWTAHRRPYVIAKIALSKDYKSAYHSRRPAVITTEQTKVFTHQQRLISDAIMTTAETIIADNPKMNVRLSATEQKKPLYILDTTLRLPLTSQVFNTTAAITVFYHQDVANRLPSLAGRNVRCIKIMPSPRGLDLNAAFDHIGSDGVHRLWIEVGGRCFESCIRQNLLQSAYIYLSPHSLGKEGLQAFSKGFNISAFLANAQHFNSGEDTIYLWNKDEAINN